MAGRRPDLKISAKAKNGDKRVPIAAAWKSDRGKGYGLKFEDGVAAILLTNGERITVGKEGSHYVDVYMNDGDAPPRESQPQSDERDGGYDGEIPF